MISKSEKQLRLYRKHPDWTAKQFAEALGQSEATVRGVFSRNRISLKGKRTSMKKQVEAKPKPKPLPSFDGSRVFSKCGPRAYGYTKLI